MDDLFLRIQTFFTALPLGFGLLHLILFAALPRLRSNLYYGLFLTFIAAAVFCDFQEQMMGSGEGGGYLRGHRGALALSLVFGIRFFYEAFLGRTPRRYRYLAAALLATGAVAVAEPYDLFWPLEAVLLVALIEVGRIMGTALRRRRTDARLIAGGFVVFAAFALYDLLLDFGLLSPVGRLTNAYQFGLVGLFGATSAVLARTIARTTRQLVEQERRVRAQEVERRLLEAEVDRTQRELEEARALQLSMLPSAVPAWPEVAVAVHLKTAAEVGGDYYDFGEEPEGVRVVAVGDATGHGLRAGIMVAIVKSLVQGLRPDEALPAFFRRCTQVLKPMRLGNLFMALTLVRLRGADVTVAAAGMPPLLVYRAASGTAERVTLKGMPLGAFADFPYRQARLTLGDGDALLLMTDGLMELFDERREMLGLVRVTDAFAEAGAQPPEAIVDHLRAVGDAWRGATPQADDVALVVLKRTGVTGNDEAAS